MQGRKESGEFAWTTTATERAMVAFDGRPHSQRLLRCLWRLSRGLKASFLAFTMVSPRSLLHAHSPEAAQLSEQMQLAEDLGAEVLRVEGRDSAAALAQAAHQRHITQL
jgi:K+-sensing histidine kinase KdpD